MKVEIEKWPEGKGIDDALAAGIPTETVTGAAARREASAVVAEAEEWPEPTPLSGPPVPPFPVHVLPDWMRRWVVAQSVALQVPADLPGMLALAACSIAVVGRFRVRARSGWEEPINIYVIVALPPAERKSAVFREAVRPIEDAEATFIHQAGLKLAVTKAEREVCEDRLKAAKKDASKPGAEPAAIALVAQLAGQFASMKSLASPRLLAADVTPEKLGAMLNEQGGNLGIATSEGCSIFDMAGGRYSDKPNFDILLQAHSGDPVRVARVSREDILIPHPALTLALTVQPSVIAGLSEQATFRGRGLLARFLWSLPVSTVGGRAIGPPPVSESTRGEYRERILRLIHLNRPAIAELPLPPVTVELAPDANAALARFEKWLEPQLSPTGELPGAVQEWAGKLAGATVRLAGLLHLADHATEFGHPIPSIPAPTMERAIVIATYLLHHSRAAFGLMGADPAREGAIAVLAWLRHHGEPTVTRRDIHQKLRSRFQRAADLDAPLDLLVDFGWLRLHEVPTEPRVGRPSQRLDVHPKAFKAPQSPRSAEQAVPSPANLSAVESAFERFEHSVQRTTEMQVLSVTQPGSEELPVRPGTDSDDGAAFRTGEHAYETFQHVAPAQFAQNTQNGGHRPPNDPTRTAISTGPTVDDVELDPRWQADHCWSCGRSEWRLREGASRVCENCHPLPPRPQIDGI